MFSRRSFGRAVAGALASVVEPRKQCRACELDLPLSSFTRHALTADRLQSHCKACRVAEVTAWVRANPAKAAANKKAYVERHPERRREAQRRYRECTPEAHAASRHRTRQSGGALVPWYDRALVRDIYKLARVCREAGIDCHVDHQVPLRSPTVSGLHVQDNLTVLLASDNRRKGSAVWPDMP
jgi:hypothetical protein